MKKIFSLLAAAMLALGMNADELTVADGTATNASLPLCSYYFDYGFHSQMLYGNTELEGLEGATLTGLTFYSSTDTQSWGKGTVSVKIAEVEETTLTTTPLAPTFTEVFSGSCSIAEGELTFVFATPFTYSSSKSLLLDIETTKNGSASSGDVWFYGKEVTASGFSTRMKQGTYTYSAGVANFLPKATFVFEGGAVISCPRPSKLTSTVTADGAVFEWQAGEGAQHQVCVVAKDAAPAGWTLLGADVLTYTAKGLAAGTTYDFYVRTYCSETEQSAEVKASFTPECKAPAEVTLSELTHNTATLSWTAVAGIDQYQFVCVRKDSVPDWAGVEAKAVLSATTDTLQASTSYDFYVRSYFSAETQSAATKLTFTTNCVALELPYKETFASNEKPACWKADNWGTSYNYWNVDTYEDHTGDGSYVLRYNARTSSSSYVVTASIDLADDALLDFYYQNRYGYGSAIAFDIIVMDASNDAELLSESVTTASPNGEWAQKTIDLSAHTGKTVKIKFVGKGNGGGSSAYLRIDDISVTAKPCTAPTGLKAAVSSIGAIITWNAGGSEAAWNLRYKLIDAEEWTELKDITEPTYTMTGCIPDTTYEVQVQAACNAGKQSPWTASVQFVPVCPVPTKPVVSQIEDNRAVVAWESPEEIFNLQYKEADGVEWITVDSIEAKSYVLTDLKAGTAYKVQVQSACGSAYSTAASFTTQCAPLAEAIPFAENFDSIPDGMLPDCWFVLPVDAEVGVMTMNEGGKKLYMTGEQERWVILPAFEATLSGLTLSFTYSGAASLEVGYLTSANEATFVTLAAVSASPVECDLKDVPAEAKYLAIRYIGTTYYSAAYIDEIVLNVTTTTGISHTAVSSDAVKTIENGQLVLIKNGVRYNAQGTVLR